MSLTCWFVKCDAVQQIKKENEKRKKKSKGINSQDTGLTYNARSM